MVRKQRPCPDGQHRPAKRSAPPLGAPLPICRKCGWAYM
jgi:hypothetical protein